MGDGSRPAGQASDRSRRLPQGGVVIGLDNEPLAVPCARLVRLRSVMPEESPIDLDEHAALIAYEVERRADYPTLLKQRGARIRITEAYVRDVHRFLDEVRHVLP